MAFKSKKNNKSLNCKECSEEVINVGEDATAVICWKCVSKALSKGASCLMEDIEPDPPGQEKE